MTTTKVAITKQFAKRTYITNLLTLHLPIFIFYINVRMNEARVNKITNIIN